VRLLLSGEAKVEESTEGEVEVKSEARGDDFGLRGERLRDLTAGGGKKDFSRNDLQLPAGMIEAAAKDLELREGKLDVSVEGLRLGGGEWEANGTPDQRRSWRNSSLVL